MILVLLARLAQQAVLWVPPVPLEILVRPGLPVQIAMLLAPPARLGILGLLVLLAT